LRIEDSAAYSARLTAVVMKSQQFLYEYKTEAPEELPKARDVRGILKEQPQPAGAEEEQPYTTPTEGNGMSKNRGRKKDV